MKILVLTQVLPFPLDSGPKVKTYHVLRYLAERHDVTLLSFMREDDPQSVAQLESFCRSVHTVHIDRSMKQELAALLKSLVTGEPFMMLRDQQQAMLDRLAVVLARTEFDVILADQLNMAHYVKGVPGRRKILDAHNALWLVYRRLSKSSRSIASKLLFSREWKRLRSYELEAARDFDIVLSVSEEDREALIEIGIPAAKIQVIPISIDVQEFEPIERKNTANRILHLGTMFWPPNSEGVSWFLEEIWPLILRENPEAEFDIVGARPPQSLVRIAGATANVRVHGYVADVKPFLESTAVMVVPLRAAGGMRVKILNALAQEIPVVTTTVGCEGIRAEHFKHLLIADSPEEFARATNLLLQDRGQAALLAQNGRKLVESRYDYRKTMESLDGILSLPSFSGPTFRGER